MYSLARVCWSLGGVCVTCDSCLSLQTLKVLVPLYDTKCSQLVELWLELITIQLTVAHLKFNFSYRNIFFINLLTEWGRRSHNHFCRSWVIFGNEKKLEFYSEKLTSLQQNVKGMKRHYLKFAENCSVPFSEFFGCPLKPRLLWWLICYVIITTVDHWVGSNHNKLVFFRTCITRDNITLDLRNESINARNRSTVHWLQNAESGTYLKWWYFH